MTSTSPSDQPWILNQLNEIFEVEFTFLDTSTLATTIARHDKAEQIFYLDLARRIASTQIPLSYEIITRALNNKPVLAPEFIKKWALYTMDVYDSSGLQAAMALARQPDIYQAHYHTQTYGVEFADIEIMLGHFVHGLSGRPLNLQATDGPAYTDSEIIYLPQQIASQPQKKENFELYKATVVYLWGQTRFGTFRESLEDFKKLLDGSDQFKALFMAIEYIRLQKNIVAHLPGIERIFQQFNPCQKMDRLWAQLSAKLTRHSNRENSLQLTSQYLNIIKQIPDYAYLGVINIDSVYKTQQQRIINEQACFKVKLEQQLNELKQQHRQLSTRSATEVNDLNGLDIELTLDGIPMKLPLVLNKLCNSIKLDFGEIPPEYLTPAGSGDYDIAQLNEADDDSKSVWHGSYHENDASLYDEWDHQRQAYRKNWCAVRETDIHTSDQTFINNTYTIYQTYIHKIRRVFEAIRDEERRLKKQSNGDDIDLNAFVDSFADQIRGHEVSEQLFTRLQRHDRNIAVLFMVDMSGSTRGWINDAEREALIILCNAINLLGDRFAIYGFSGISRKRCEIFRVKEFTETFTQLIEERISGMEPKEYTRMGPAIRHLSHKLNQTSAKTRILITLSDGKPDDYNDYHGEYGIEDTRKALIEARRSGIHPYCITIDHEARDYLSHMYGPAAFTVINDVRQLPLKVSDIYRKLTL